MSMMAPRDEIGAAMRRLGLTDLYRLADAKITRAENSDVVVMVTDSRVLSVMDGVQGGTPGISCTIEFKSLQSGNESDPTTREYWFLHFDEAERFAGITQNLDPASLRVCPNLGDFNRRAGCLLPALSNTLREIANSETGGSLQEKLIAKLRKARGL